MLFIVDLSRAETNNLTFSEENKIEIDYLESRNELEDYIIDTGDVIAIEFFPAEDLNGIFPVNAEGELFLPTIKETYVRGLTLFELKNLLEKRYDEFLIDPEIDVRIALFKSVRVFVKGELRDPGFYTFPSYQSASFYQFEKQKTTQLLAPDSQSRETLLELEIGGVNTISTQDNRKYMFNNKFPENITTISDAIKKAGGITSLTDLSRIQIIRDVPIGKGGGQKRAIIDLYSYINESDLTNDIRIFDGDTLFFPKLDKPNPSQISRSILTGISPKFVSVNIFGRVETPGIIQLPLEATLSDAIDLTGPIKPLSGNIVLIRYEKDGKVLKKNISYLSRAKRGSKRNPFIKDGDLITVKDSFLGKSTRVIRDITAPFVGIYSTKEIFESFND